MMFLNKYRKCTAFGALTVSVFLMMPQHLLAETRCGWFDNPTPANNFLTDADGDWILTMQGGYRVDGYDDLPPASFKFKEQWQTFGAASYGYGCACLVGKFDLDTGYMIRVESMRPQPLEQCHMDPDLPSREQ